MTNSRRHASGRRPTSRHPIVLQFRCRMTSKRSSQPSAEEGEIMAQKKFLVTGATGASGVHTVEQLLGRGHQVRETARLELLTANRCGLINASRTAVPGSALRPCSPSRPLHFDDAVAGSAQIASGTGSGRRLRSMYSRKSLTIGHGRANPRRLSTLFAASSVTSMAI